MNRLNMTRGALKGLVVLLLLMLLIGAANLLYTARQTYFTETHARTSCAFYADIGTAPIIPPKSGVNPSKLGVTIVLDSRRAWYGLACPGHLAPLSARNAFWAHHYRIPLPPEDVAVGQG